MFPKFLYEGKNMNRFDIEDENAENKIEGRNPVIEALRAGREIDKILVQSG